MHSPQAETGSKIGVEKKERKRKREDRNKDIKSRDRKEWMKKEQGDLVKESPFLPLQKVSYHSACLVYCLMYMLRTRYI